MTDAVQSSLPSDAAGSKHIAPRIVVILIALIVFVVGGIGLFPGALSIFQPQDNVALLARLDSLQQRVKALEEKSATPPESQQNVSVADSQALSQSGDVEKLKQGLAGLSAALGTLQTEIEKSSKVSSENRVSAQTGLASLVGYIQLQRAAVSGHPFEKERQDLRKLVEGDQTMTELLGKLEPVAATGAPQALALAKDWRALSAEAQTVLRQAGAQSWLDRIVVALEGLISIRSLNPKAGNSLAFAGIENDLDVGAMRSAMEKVDALPGEVKQLIAPWRDRLQANLLVGEVLDSMAQHLMSRGGDDAAVQPQPGGA